MWEPEIGMEVKCQFQVGGVRVMDVTGGTIEEAQRKVAGWMKVNVADVKLVEARQNFDSEWS